ncbi:MAG TPA: rod shape-determining protein MreD [Patescibacteria group bacterium]|nr:rod shape-determining protein MreD [Patescibacteria group bacterium]
MAFRQLNPQTMARLALPQFLLAGLVLLSVLSLPLPYAGSVRPCLVLMAVYYWAIFRPTLVPPFLCFLAGLLMDILSGMPLGVNALVLVAVQWVVRGQRRFLMAQPYKVLWAVFGLVVVLASALTWLLFGIMQRSWAPLPPLAGTAAASFLLFPLVSWILIFVHRTLPAVDSRNY